MKNIFKLFLLSILVFTVSCENETDPRFQDNPETGWIQFSRSSTTVAVTSRTTTITIPVDFTAPINLSDLNVSYAINNIQGDPNNVVTGLGTSIRIAGNTNRALISLDPVDDAVQQLIDGGDVVFEIELTSASRGIGVGLADGSARTVHTVNLLCGGEPQPGAYVIDMQDSFGDGWQTDVSLGGSGMTATLLDLDGNETVVEFGMCSPYGGNNLGTFLDPATGACTGPASTSFFNATATVQVPPGTVDVIWNFPGDFYGEISFQIYLPSGSLLYDSGGPGDLTESPIELAVSYCQ
jgi:hypothetical protein